MSVAEVLPYDEARGISVPDESALEQSADFFNIGRSHLRLVDETYVPPPPILDTLLAEEQGGEGIWADKVFGLNEYIKGLLAHEKDKHYRDELASFYGDIYRSELNVVDEETLSDRQHAALLLSRLYLSSLSSLGHLGLFIETNRWVGIKSPEAEEAKVRYLAARKVYQDDVDQFLDYFQDETDETLIEVLKDISNMTRLTLKRQKFVDSHMDDHTHVFVGSVLSERLVKISMQEFIDPDVRYGDENEDRSPTQADVVWPRQDGDFYVQVKMRWTKPTNLKVKRKKEPKPTHVIVPLMSLRGDLTMKEHQQITETITEVAESKARERKLQEACALGGLKKHIALCRIPFGELKQWWFELKDVISEEKLSYSSALQTGVDRLE